MRPTIPRARHGAPFDLKSLRQVSALGWLAQLVERLVYTENVGGSKPSPPTISALPDSVFNFDVIAQLDKPLFFVNLNYVE